MRVIIPRTGDTPGSGYENYRGVVLTGIGGQGIVFAAQLLRKAIGGRYGNLTGYDVRGGAQRYGHVAAVIRFDSKGASESIQGGMDLPPGRADFVVSLEASEGLRYADRIGRATTVIMDRYTVIPTNVRRSGGTYPGFDQAREAYDSIAGRVIALDLRKGAAKFGAARVDANLLALGVLCAASQNLIVPADFEWAASSREMDLIRAGYEKFGVAGGDGE